MSKKNEDKLIQFFRENLQNPESTDSLWDTPPEFVFDNAMAKVDAQNDKRRSRRYLILLFFFALGILSAIYFQTQEQINELNDKIEVLDQQIAEKTTSLSTSESLSLEGTANKEKKASANQDIQSSIASDFDLGINGQSTSQEATTPTNNNRSLTTTPINNMRKTVPSRSTVQNTNTLSNTNQNITQSPLTNSETTNSATTGASNQNAMTPMANAISATAIPSARLLETVAALKAIQTLKAQGLSYPFSPAALSLDLSDVPVQEMTTDKINPWSLQMGFVQNFSTVSMDNIPASAPALYDYDSHYYGNGAYVGATYDLGIRWGLSGNLSYQKINSSSHLVDSQAYDTANEIYMSNGDMMYETEVPVETPFGNISEIISLDLEPSTASPDDRIHQDTYMDQQLSLLSFSLGPQYTLIQSQKVNFSVQAGLTYNHVTAQKSTLNTSLTMGDKTLLEFSNSMDKVGSIKSYYINTYLGAGLNYNISDRYALGLSAQYTNALNSIRVNAAGQGPNTFINSFSVSTGVSYRF